MNRSVLVLALALIVPAVASGQRLAPGDAPRGAPSETQSTPPTTPSSPGASNTLERDKAPGGSPSGPQTARPGSNPAKPSSAQDGDAPMRFELVREGPESVCGKNCRTWVSASGRITPDTGRDFQVFAQGKQLRGLVVVLESNGGTVGSGLDIGRAFRKLDMTTTVGKTTILPGDNGETRATLSPRAVCASMCAFALLGGARRHVPAEARVLVHQIWPSSKREDAAAQTYVAENLVSLQRSLGAIARFIVEMGVDIEVFDLAMRIPPWERMRSLSSDEMRRMRVRTVENPFDPPMTATGPAVALPPPTESVTPAAVPASGAWTFAERAGLRGLTRRHPLTVEGDDIGSFEILFACGDAPDAYALHYSEKRRRGEARDRLSKVLVVSGKERVNLTIQSSTRGDNDLDSVAHGSVPAALLDTFADAGEHSIVVSTETSGNQRTLIRIGNTGLRAMLPHLAATCRKTASVPPAAPVSTSAPGGGSEPVIRQPR
jgi:hypothetical protein